MYTTEQKLKIAAKAVNQVLKRIGGDLTIQGKIGPLTETYDVVTAAAAALSGQPQDEIMERTIPGSSDAPHSTVEDYL